MELALGLGLLLLAFLGGYAYGIRVGHRAGLRSGISAGEQAATGRLLENGMIEGPVPFMGHVL